MKKKRFDRDDWLEFALAQLAEHGPEVLKLAKLCKAAGRTTGSFYHHFEDHNVFTDEMLSFWRKRNTEDVIEAIEDIPEHDYQAERLNTIAMTMNQRVEIGIRAFAQQNKEAERLVAEVDEIRIAHLTDIYSNRFDLSAELSKNLAEIEYAAFVGTQMIWKGASLEHGMKLSNLFNEMVRSHIKKS